MDEKRNILFYYWWKFFHKALLKNPCGFLFSTEVSHTRLITLWRKRGENRTEKDEYRQFLLFVKSLAFQQPIVENFIIEMEHKDDSIKKSLLNNPEQRTQVLHLEWINIHVYSIIYRKYVRYAFSTDCWKPLDNLKCGLWCFRGRIWYYTPWFIFVPSSEYPVLTILVFHRGCWKLEILLW